MSDIRELVNEKKPKASKPKSESKGLISKEFFEFNLENVFEYSRPLTNSHRLRNIRFTNEEYVPLYAVNFKVDHNLPVNNILTGDFTVDAYSRLLSEKHGRAIWQCNNVYVNFIKKCVETEQYNLILFLKHKEDSVCTSASMLKENLKKRFDEYVNSPVDISVHREGRNTAKNYADIISNTKYYCGWSKSRTRRKDADAPVLHFLSNFYYMAKLNEHNNNYWIEPLFSVMVKKDYLPYVRACLLTNTPLPVDILELWIDNRLDKVDSNIAIRPTFVKSIKTPFKQAGVNIRTFDNLFDEMYTRLKLPKFRSIPERMEWVKELSVRLLDESRVNLGIKTREQVQRENRTPLFADRSERSTNNDVKREVEKRMEQFTTLVTELTS